MNHFWTFSRISSKKNMQIPIELFPTHLDAVSIAVIAPDLRQSAFLSQKLVSIKYDLDMPHCRNSDSGNEKINHFG